MNAVTSTLDRAHYRQVEEIWAEPAASFGGRGVYVTPYPHFACCGAAQRGAPWTVRHEMSHA